MLNFRFRSVAWLCSASLLLGSALRAEAGEMPVSDRFIEPCPKTPNCVSSRDRDEGRFIRPLSFDGAAEQAWKHLRTALLEDERVRVVAEGPGVLRAESTSRVFRFVDDLEFRLIPEEHIIDVRSASRVGYWDLGVNRRRVERIRERFQALMAQR
jgi:uncharacterized protein (DUF1499 family)